MLEAKLKMLEAKLKRNSIFHHGDTEYTTMHGEYPLVSVVKQDTMGFVAWASRP